jgi:F-type H+-transporting ATPase subunit b
MPQFDQILATYASQVFWLLIVFGLIFFTIGYGMLPKIEAGIDARDLTIANNLAAAERARVEANSLGDSGSADIAEARSAAQAKANEAKALAAKDAQLRLAKADAEISAKAAVAEQELARATAKAMASIEDVAAEAAAEIVAKVSGAKVNSAQAASAVKVVLANG